MIDSIWRLFNKKVKCPCCGWEGNEFKPTGVKKRKNAKCPQCSAVERHRIFYLFLRDYLPKNKPIKLLHFAPEPSIANLFQSYKNIEYLSADIDPEKAMVVEDILNLSFMDNIFDYIFCSHVLEHIPDDIKAMSELCRILKPGGMAIISVPVYNIDRTYENPSITLPQERIEHFGQHDHVRKYGPDIIDRLRKVFQNVEEMHYINTISKKNIKKYVLKDRILYLCSK